jgi:hypothetical protein
MLILSSFHSISKQAVKEISMTFRSYTAVVRINRLWKHVNEIQQQLKSQLDGDFDDLYVSSLSPYEFVLFRCKVTFKTRTNQSDQSSWLRHAEW